MHVDPQRNKLLAWLFLACLMRLVFFFWDLLFGKCKFGNNTWRNVTICFPILFFLILGVTEMVMASVIYKQENRIYYLSFLGLQKT